MPEKTLTCPMCKGEMRFRLGEWHCTACSFRLQEVQQAPAEPAATGPSRGSRSGAKPGDNDWKNTGSGLSREANSYGGGWQPPAGAPPPPPAGGGYSIGAVPPKGLYDPDERRPGGSQSLPIEKNIYFALSMLSVFAYIAIAFNVDSTYGFASLFGAGIGAGLLAFVLYGEAIWAKMLCGGFIVLIWVVDAIAFMFVNEQTWNWLQYYSFASGDRLMTAIILMTAYNLAWNAWFLSILWRDAKELRGEV